MRDDRKKWALALGMDRPAIENNHLKISIVETERQTLISGPHEKSLKFCKLQQASDWPQIASENNYALRLRRDRILVINGPLRVDGWHDKNGVSVSDMSSAYVIIQIEGDFALELLNRGTDLNLDVPSKSVSRTFQGFGILIYPWQSTDQFRMHIPHTNLEAMWLLMQTFSNQITKEQTVTNS